MTKLKFTSFNGGEINFQKCLRCKVNDFLFICCQACKFGEGGIYGNHLVRSSGCSKCVPGLYLSDRRRRIKLIIHKNITYDLWVYHDLDLRSFRQEHLQEKCKVCVLSISFFLEEIRSCYFTQSLLLTSGCHELD